MTAVPQQSTAAQILYGRRSERKGFASVWMCLLESSSTVATVEFRNTSHPISLMHEGQDPRNSRARSLSGDFEVDTDFESHAGDSSHPPGKPGRKKNPNSQAARRDQNRIAQREFRLRKQQRIRDLEARVELLSGGKDEVMSEMRNMLKDLMAENQTLRSLLRSLAAFIGEGAGGLLPKLGWDATDFNDFINKSETDTAWEGYQKRKKAQVSGAGPAVMQSRKRSSEDDPVASRSKKARNDDNSLEDRQNGFSMLVQVPQSSVAPPSLYSTSQQTQERPAMFAELMQGPNGSQMFMQPSTPTNSAQYPAPSVSNLNSYPPSYVPGVNMNMEQTMSSSDGSSQGMQRSNPVEPPDELDDEEDPKRNEAYKLISYHLENYKRNSSYCLPASLRPTLVQRTIPHESFLDRVLHPELRDRMILFRDRYDLLDCAMDLRQSIIIHGDDVLAHSNWEIGDKFLRTYGFLIDTAVLKVSNRWRRERGEPELSLSDINGERQVQT